MLHPISVQGAGIVSHFGINTYDAVSSFFERSEKTCSPIQEVIAKTQIRDYLSEYQKEIPDVRYMDSVAKKGIMAARGSINSAEISVKEINNNPYRYGILLATKRGPVLSRAKLYESLTSRNEKSVSATVFSNCGYNIAASLIAGFFGLKGVNLTLSGGPDLAFSLLQRAANFLYNKRLDTVFVGFSDTSNDDGQPGRISLADVSCILCVKRPENEPKEKRLIVEYVEKQRLNSFLIVNEPLSAGTIYGISQEPSTSKQQVTDLKFSLNHAIHSDADYLLLLQLGFLWANTLASPYKKFIIPVRTRNDEVFLIVSNDNSNVNM